MNMQAIASDLLASMETTEKVCQKQYDALTWVVGETAIMAKDRVEDGSWDLTDLREYGNDMETHGGEMGRRVNKSIKNYILKVCEEGELCPECYSKLKAGGIKKELHGECVATKMCCLDCWYEEEA